MRQPPMMLQLFCLGKCFCPSRLEICVPGRFGIAATLSLGPGLVVAARFGVDVDFASVSIFCSYFLVIPRKKELLSAQFLVDRKKKLSKIASC
mmetsp:Transcript_17937/g.44786  ORF Transcript_17937/g.44786 Transcript_17937/m.44786 type:complete len:93 (+) Transcript_17937:2924-3202(+)